MIKPYQLESDQAYHARGVHGFKRMDDYREEEGPEYFRCGLCCEAIVKDEGDYCGPCQAADDEFFADQKENR